MTAAERRRLARILGMLGSEHAGERASAALQAEAFRKHYGLTWEMMLALPPVGAEPPPAPPAPPVRDAEFTDPRRWQTKEPRPPDIKGRWLAAALFGSCAFVLVASLLAVHGDFERKVVPQPVVSADCPPPVHPPGAKISEGQRIREAYKCWP